MIKTTQRDDAACGADDSYERAAAFLSHWIEDSSLIPTANISHSLPAPDLPLSSVRLRRRNTYSNSNDGEGNEGAINSLVHSLQTSLMSHGHQNQTRSSQRGITSPSSVSTVYKPSSGGIDGVPPLPFDEWPTATQKQQQTRTFQHDESASSRRSVAASARSTRRSGNECERGRRFSVEGDTARPRPSGITKGLGSKHHCSSSSNKVENSSKRPPCSRRHTFDSDRSFTSSNKSKSCARISPHTQAGESAMRERSASIDGLNEGVLNFYASLSSLHDDRRRTASRHHSYWSNRSDEDLPSPSLHRRNHADGRKEEGDPPTMVVSLPWTDLAGNAGHYTGEVNASIQPLMDWAHYSTISGRLWQVYGTAEVIRQVFLLLPSVLKCLLQFPLQRRRSSRQPFPWKQFKMMAPRLLNQEKEVIRTRVPRKL